MMALCSNYLNDLTVCIEQFCSSDNQSYRHFIDGLTTTKQKSMTNHFNKKLLPILTIEHNQKLLTIKTK
jgi:hypothetical protein